MQDWEVKQTKDELFDAIALTYAIIDDLKMLRENYDVCMTHKAKNHLASLTLNRVDRLQQKISKANSRLVIEKKQDEHYEPSVTNFDAPPF
jgi:hypothetical protein